MYLHVHAWSCCYRSSVRDASLGQAVTSCVCVSMYGHACSYVDMEEVDAPSLTASHHQNVGGPGAHLYLSLCIMPMSLDTYPSLYVDVSMSMCTSFHTYFPCFTLSFCLFVSVCVLFVRSIISVAIRTILSSIRSSVSSLYQVPTSQLQLF